MSRLPLIGAGAVLAAVGFAAAPVASAEEGPKCPDSRPGVAVHNAHEIVEPYAPAVSEAIHESVEPAVCSLPVK